jgi:hypothetical protein
MGLNCARGKQSGQNKGRYRDLGYSRFVNDVGIKKEWMPQSRATWVALPGKEGHQG